MTETYYSMTELVKLADNLIAAMPTSFYGGIMAVRGGLASLPAADVAPVRRGRWIVDDFTEIIKCSECDNDAPLETTGGEQWSSPFCPNCGARMDGPEPPKEEK